MNKILQICYICDVIGQHLPDSVDQKPLSMINSILQHKHIKLFSKV